MRSFLQTSLFILLVQSVSAATINLSGALGPPGTSQGSQPRDGTFSLRLSGDWLDYSITTRRLADTFVIPDAGLLLGLPSGSLSLRFAAHGAFGINGCSAFSLGTPLSWRYDGPGVIGIPLSFDDPGICDAYISISILSGSILLSPQQAADFGAPEFDLTFFARPDPSVGPEVAFYGRTDPNVFVVVPEPSSLYLLALSGVLLRRSRQ